MLIRYEDGSRPLTPTFNLNVWKFLINSEHYWKSVVHLILFLMLTPVKLQIKNWKIIAYHFMYNVAHYYKFWQFDEEKRIYLQISAIQVLIGLMEYIMMTLYAVGTLCSFQDTDIIP